MDAFDKIADKASSVLDAATGGANNAAVEGAAKFTLGEMISDPEASDKGDFGTSYEGQDDTPNAMDTGIPTEFLHFGRVHADSGAKFPHELSDPSETALPPEGHAIMFRDGIEREAIMLFGFVSSTKQILQDATASRGAIADVANMAGNLLGGGSKSSKPDPAQLETFLDDIKSAVETINLETLLYPDIHAAGKKLHETRATYVEFCQALTKQYVAPPEANPLDMAAGALAQVPGVGKIMATVQRYAFKMLDLYLASYLKLREHHEATIEVPAHDLTVEAIKGNYAEHAPTFPIWFKKPDPKKPDATKEDDEDNLLKDVNEKIEEGKQKVEDTKKDILKEVDKVYDFLGVNGNPPDTPGSAALSQAFANLKGSPETVEGATPSASACIIEGLEAATKDIGGVPNFLKKVITKVNDTNVALLEEIFRRLMASEIKGEINSQLLLEAGRRHLSVKLVEMMADLAGGVLPSKDFAMNTPTGDGKKFSAQQFVAKLIDDKLAPFADPIIQYAMGDLAGQLEASRAKAAANDAQTMEVFLGRLPWLTALMFKNTFFPMWNLVVEKVFETISPSLAKMLKEVNGIFERGKDAIDKADDYRHRAGNVKEKASAFNVTKKEDFESYKEGINKARNDESEEGRLRREERERQQREKESLDAFYTANDKDEKFPVTDRKIKASGVKVTEEVEEVPVEAAA